MLIFRSDRPYTHTHLCVYIWSFVVIIKCEIEHKTTHTKRQKTREREKRSNNNRRNWIKKLPQNEIYLKYIHQILKHTIINTIYIKISRPKSVCERWTFQKKALYGSCSYDLFRFWGVDYVLFSKRECECARVSLYQMHMVYSVHASGVYVYRVYECVCIWRAQMERAPQSCYQLNCCEMGIQKKIILWAKAIFCRKKGEKHRKREERERECIVYLLRHSLFIHLYLE